MISDEKHDKIVQQLLNAAAALRAVREELNNPYDEKKSLVVSEDLLTLAQLVYRAQETIVKANVEIALLSIGIPVPKKP